MGDSVKSLAEVRVDNIHCSPSLIHICQYVNILLKIIFFLNTIKK